MKYPFANMHAHHVSSRKRELPELPDRSVKRPLHIAHNQGPTYRELEGLKATTGDKITYPLGTPHPVRRSFDTDRVYFIRVDGNKMMVKSPGAIVPITGQTSVVEFELVKSE